MINPGDQYARLSWIYTVTHTAPGRVTYTSTCGSLKVTRAVPLTEWQHLIRDAEPLLECIMRERNLTEEQAQRWL
jgi:hypothetical protein